MSRFAGRTGPILLGMVGGGQGAFIGAVHRIAARMDNEYQLVAGALSSTPEKARASADELGIARAYDSFEAMAEAEAGRPDGIEAVSIVTPNHVHLPAAKAFLERGINVICDKPLTGTLADAEALAATARASDAVFALTHNYTGYPMVRQARAMVANGALGTVRVVNVEYPQDWLAKAPDPDNKQAAWRTDPAQTGAGGAIGDIGTHAYNLATFVSGLTLTSLAADMQSFVPGRRVDDNAHVMLRFEGGARGLLWASQVATGNVNALKLRVHGETAGLFWSQEEPNTLRFASHGEPSREYVRGGPGMLPEAQRAIRIPAGHPEGFLEAFATLYTEAARAIRARRDGTAPSADVTFPGIEDGLAGVRFVDSCVRSSAADAAWVQL